MIQEIKAKIGAINELLTWLQKNKPELYEQRFVQLVQERCQLRTIMEAKKENPAIAAYGESQKGKSYLMGNLLQRDGKPFMISLPSGEKINFVKSINPIGKKREATGVVTRFTAFNNRNADRYCPQYPVLMKLLSVSDMAIILCDSYYKDLQNPKHFSDQEIRELGDNLYAQYCVMPIQKDTPLVEDDILDIKNYIMQHEVAYSLFREGNNSIFDKLALVVRRIPQSDWPDVLNFLWHKNEVLTGLFRRLVNAMAKLKFADEVYLPIEAVRHGGVNENTIMSVACLNGLDNPSFNLTSNVYLRNGNEFKTITDFNKAELCAICAETAYKVDEEYLSTTVKYCTDMLPSDTLSKMKNKELRKDVINVSDLLDFPGARNRLNNLEERLSDYDEKEQASNLVKSLLRGKVAYLFNKYCSSRNINILMFCHDDEQCSVTSMYGTIEKWVNQYVGDTAEKRIATVERSEGIAPLFIIATKFNIDMTLDQNDIDSELNSPAAVDGRWKGRFQTVLYQECLQGHSVEWFRHWSGSGEEDSFKNTYLLRDFKYSACSGDGSSIYEGYNENDENPSETTLHIPQVFYDRLRSSFISSDIVGKFFDDPALSWDLASTLNNDGALYIIERLRTVAYNMDTIRDRQFQDEIRECMNRVYKLMVNEYEPEDDSETIRKDVKAAKGIMKEMDLSCEVDMYFFGHLIQTLQLDHTLAYNAVDDFVNNHDPGNPEESVYQIIMKRCGNFEGCQTDGEKMHRYMAAYACDTEEEADEDMKRRGIDKRILFREKEVRLSNSAQVSQKVYSIWIRQLQSSDLFNRLLTGRYHDEAALSALTSRLVVNAERLNLADHLADAVSKYLDIVNIHTTNIDMVSDIITNYINQFVCDMGYSLLSSEQLENAKIAAQQNSIVIDAYIGKGVEPLPSEAMISDLFTNMMQRNEGLTRTFEQNYNEWIEYMFIAFLNGNIRVIKNPEANRELGTILKRLK